MAGRHNWDALASGLDLMGGLMAQQQEDEKKRQDRAQELYQKLQMEVLLEEVKKGRLGLNPQTGRLEPRTPQPMQVPGGLEPSAMSYQDASGVTRSYARPTAASDTLPANEKFFLDNMSPGRPLAGAPTSAVGQSAAQGALNLGQTESPAATQTNNYPAPQPGLLQHLMSLFRPGGGASTPTPTATADPIVRTGTDTKTGRRVGQTRSGKIVPLQ